MGTCCSAPGGSPGHAHAGPSSRSSRKGGGGGTGGSEQQQHGQGPQQHSSPRERADDERGAANGQQHANGMGGSPPHAQSPPSSGVPLSAHRAALQSTAGGATTTQHATQNNTGTGGSSQLNSSSQRAHKKGRGGGGDGGSSDKDYSQSRTSKRSEHRLEAITEDPREKENGHSPLHNRKDAGRRNGKGGGRDGGLAVSPRSEYQTAHSSLTHGGSAAMMSEQQDMDKAMLSIPFFDSLDLKHVKILRSFFTRRVYAPKEVVLAEGLPLGQQVFHIIINGRVEMCAKDAYGKRTVLQQFGAGDYFGELAWNANQDSVQPVTVYALQRTTILYTSSHQFAAALEQFPQLSVAINVSGFADDSQLPKSSSDSSGSSGGSGSGPRSLGIGAPIQIQLKTIPFFADIEELKLQQLAMLCEIKKKKAGTWICIQGADADGFYFILRGRVEVSARGFVENEGGGNPGAGAAGSNHAHDKAGASGGHHSLFSFGGASGSPSAHQRTHRGSGNSGTVGGGSNFAADNSPMFGGRARRSADLLSPHSPGTPLTGGLTPSPPSTPPQRPVPQSSSRKSNAGSGGGRGDASVLGLGGKATRGASFSGSSGNATTGGDGSSGTRPGDADDGAKETVTPPPPGAQNAYLDTLREGDWFGEIALIEKTTRTASVRATQDCILLYLSRERFIRFLKFAPSIKSSALFTDIIRKRTANSLKSLPIFAPLKIKTIGPYHQFDEKRLALLGDMFHFLTVPANTTLFNEGDFNLAFYIVVTGTAIVTAKSPTLAAGEEGADIFLQELQPNDYFGEAGLLHRMRCNATVKTKTNCLLLKLNGENFASFLKIAPEVETLFRQRLNMRTSDRLKSIPFFRGIRENKPWSKLDLLGALFQFEEFAQNELVFAQGSIGTKFYIICAGEIEISIAKEIGAQRQVLDVLGNGTGATTMSAASVAAAAGAGAATASVGTPGVSTGACYFGEISLLRRTARTASARCISPNGAVLLSIDSSRFQKFLRIAPELAEDFTSLLIHRTSNLLKSFDLFKQIQENRPWSKMEMIASLFEYELVEANQTIYKPGMMPERFYVIASGTVRLESKWAGMQTLHSQSTFGSMELMQNIQNEKKHKRQLLKLQQQQQQQQQQHEAAGDKSALPALPKLDPPALVLRTHTAKAVDVCGLMWMSIASFKSLLSLAPEILPYFSAIAEHETRQVSEMAHAASEAEKNRSSGAAAAAASSSSPSGAATPQSPGTANSADSSSSPADAIMARGSISTLVLPPPSRGAVGVGGAGVSGAGVHKSTLLSAADSFETDSPSSRERDRDREPVHSGSRARGFAANMEARRRASVPIRKSDDSTQPTSSATLRQPQLLAASNLQSASSFSPSSSSAASSSSSPPSAPLQPSAAAALPQSAAYPLSAEDPAGSSGPSPGPLGVSSLELEDILLDERASQLSAFLARSPAGAHGSRDLTDLGHLIPPSPPVLAALRAPSLALLPEVDLAASSNARRAAKVKAPTAVAPAPAASSVPPAHQTAPAATAASVAAAPASTSSFAAASSSSSAIVPAPVPLLTGASASASALLLPAAVGTVPSLPLAPSHSSASSSAGDAAAAVDVEVDSEESTKAWLLASAFVLPSAPAPNGVSSSSSTTPSQPALSLSAESLHVTPLSSSLEGSTAAALTAYDPPASAVDSAAPSATAAAAASASASAPARIVRKRIVVSRAPFVPAPATLVS